MSSYEQGVKDTLTKVRHIGDLNNPDNMSMPDKDGYEGMFISYKQLIELEEKLCPRSGEK